METKEQEDKVGKLAVRFYGKLLRATGEVKYLKEEIACKDKLIKKISNLANQILAYSNRDSEHSHSALVKEGSEKHTQLK
jgi:hypothetical protein